MTPAAEPSENTARRKIVPEKLEQRVLVAFSDSTSLPEASRLAGLTGNSRACVGAGSRELDVSDVWQD
ncbi:MAG: hypothetical protein ACRDRR_21650 [Pseudonocardiaceae bacterium]